MKIPAIAERHGRDSSAGRPRRFDEGQLRHGGRAHGGHAGISRGNLSGDRIIKIDGKSAEKNVVARSGEIAPRPAGRR